MSMPQVGQGAVAVVPTFKGFRTAVNKETDVAANESARGFRRLWSKEGATTGRAAGAGFKQAFDDTSSGFAAKSTRELEQAVAKASRTLSQARLRQLDQVGRVRVAEAQLAEAQEKHATGSSQVLRAMERLNSETRKLETANEATTRATEDLKDAQSRLVNNVGSGERAGRNWAVRFGSGLNSGLTEIFQGSFLGSFLGNLASNIVSRIGNAIGQGLRAAVEFGLGTIDIASDLNESVNAVNVSYGDVAGQILALGDTSARTFGLSRRDLNQYAVQFSAFSKGIAGPGGDVVGTFSSILGRATDFASVMNLEVAEALGLFQSGLAGETEPLRRFGIDLSAAAVEAYAYATGIAESGTELSEAQKQQARYKYLLEQTAAVQGDFAATSDELANKNRINAATWDDLQAKIGNAFLPVASALATMLSETVFPAIDKLITEHGPALAEAFEAAIPAFESFVEDVLPKLPELFETIGEAMPGIIGGLATIIPFLVDMAGKFGNGAKQIGDFFTATGEAFANGASQWGDFFTGVGEWWNATIAAFANGGNQIGSFFGAVGAAFANGWSQISSFFTQLGGALANGANQLGSFAGAVGQKIGEVLAWFGSLPGQIAGFFSNAGRWLYDSGKAIIQGFIDGVNAMFSAVGDAVGGIVEWATGFFPNSPAKRGPLSGAGWTRLKRSGSAVMEQWESGFGRPDLTGALTPALAVATAPMPGTVPASAAGATGPAVFNLFDADGVLIGTMKGVVAAEARDRKIALSAGARKG